MINLIKCICFLNVLLITGCISLKHTIDDSTMVFKTFYTEEANVSDFLNNGLVETIEINQKEKVIKYANNRFSFELNDCANTKWICISDGITNFAIKRAWSPDELTWTYNSVKYDLVSVSGNSYFISSVLLADKNTVNLIHYSTVKGILSITKFNLNENSNTYVPVTYVRE